MPKENEGESLLDAITAGIGGDEPEVETPEAELPEALAGDEEPEGDDPEGEAPEGDDPEGDDPEAAAAAKAAKPNAKEPDPINDPLPRGTLQSTAERFKHVVEKLKEQTTRAETIETQHNELIAEITGAGMDGNTFGHMLEYARGVNSGTYEGLQKSYGILMAELKSVATALGEPLPGEDILKNHPDLLKEVNDKLITPERAVEIAKQRNRAAAQEKLGQVKSTTQQSAAQHAQAVQQGKAALTALGRQLAAKDGPAEYRRKAALVVGMLRDTLPDLPPQKWVKAFTAAYAQVPPAPKAAVKASPKNQPLRGNKVPSGSSSKSPKNLREAINAAFESSWRARRVSEGAKHCGPQRKRSATRRGISLGRFLESLEPRRAHRHRVQVRNRLGLRPVRSSAAARQAAPGEELPVVRRRKAGS